MRVLSLMAVAALLFSPGNGLEAGEGSKPLAPKQEVLRLRFFAYDFDPKFPKKTTVAIHPDDRGSRTWALRINQTIPGTQLRVEGFRKLVEVGESGEPLDRSEVTISNFETKRSWTLKLNRFTTIE